jgi:uncharacterized protein
MNKAVWFDIPVIDLERAAEFYKAVLSVGAEKQEADAVTFYVLGNSGCLVPAEEEISSKGGILLYLSVEGRIRDAVSQVENHGGKVIQRIHSIDPHGYRAVVLDSEGNRIALHSTVDM